jgi:hypothetical protein
VPVVSPVDDTSLIRMTIKEEREEANNAAMEELKKCRLERAAQKLARKEQIAKEEAEEKEKRRAAIDAKLQALMAKKAELDKPLEPKLEPVEEEAVSATFLSDFVAPPGFCLEGKYLVVDEDSEANKDFEYKLEYD